jgi:hypothetical protein
MVDSAAETSRLPSGDHARAEMASVCPFRVAYFSQDLVGGGCDILVRQSSARHSLPAATRLNLPDMDRHVFPGASKILPIRAPFDRPDFVSMFHQDMSGNGREDLSLAAVIAEE